MRWTATRQRPLTAPLLESCRPPTYNPEIASGRWIFRGLGERITSRPTMSSVFLSRRRSPLLNGIAQGLSPGAAIAQPIAPPPFSHSQRRSRKTAGTCSSAASSSRLRPARKTSGAAPSFSPAKIGYFHPIVPLPPLHLNSQPFSPLHLLPFSVVIPAPSRGPRALLRSAAQLASQAMSISLPHSL